MPPSPVRFGPFELNARERRLTRDGTAIALRPKVFDTLCLLVENAGKLVTKQDLLDAVWPGIAVEENSLTHAISVIRKALEDDAGRQYVETIPRVGYRFAAPALPAGMPANSRVQAQKARQEIRYCTASDGVRLAYAGCGSGPPLVKASNWLSHLDFEWESPVWRHWWAELSSRHRLIRYDERGNGLSQRDVPELSFETWVRDLETVVEAAGLERFPLLGISRGGAIAIAYAALHPERVSHLILYGAFAKVGSSAHQGELAARAAVRTLLRLGWGQNDATFRQMFTNRFIPNATSLQQDWFSELQRISASGETAARLMEISDSIDVRGLLSAIRVPTLVVHCERDQVVPVDRGQLLAAEIPGARFVSLPSSNHLILEEEPAWRLLLEEMALFLGWS